MSVEKLEFKYEPKTFDEIVLASEIKEQLRKAIKEMPNIMLVGPPGTGKGTFTNVFLNETGIKEKRNFIKINCSDETGIDNIREKVKSFSMGISFEGVKVVYLNECDYLSHNAQAMLRDLMETVHKTTRFILCCNYGHKIIPELQSRCEVYQLDNPPAADVVKRCWWILDQENVKYDKKDVVDLVKQIWQNRPDIRKTLITLKKNIVDGKLVSGIKLSFSEEVYDEILTSMKAGDPEQVRKLLKSNTIDYTSLYKYLYDKLMTEDSVFSKDAQAILHIGEHSYRDSVVAIKEINFMHMYFRMINDEVI